MRLFIRCDQKGKIVSAMKANVIAEGLEHPYGGLGEGEIVLEIEPTAELEALYCHEICENYVVDVRSKQLKPKGETQPRPQRRRGGK